MFKGSVSTTQVRARAERAAGAGDDHGPHPVVTVCRVEGGDQLLDARRRDRVQLLGTVQGDRADALVDVVPQGLEGQAAQDPSAPTLTFPAESGTSFCSSGMTSCANRRTLRSASSYGIPA